MQYAELAEVSRSGFVESRHFGSLVALDADGRTAIDLGASDESILPRSSAKPFQALACLRAGAPLRNEQVAIAAGSHTGQDFHVRSVLDILSAAKLDEDALRCPPSRPEDEAAYAALIGRGEGESRVRMNCSGKHAAMVAACVASGWPVDTYLDADHPLQVLVRQGIEESAGEAVTHTSVDGCGAPVFAMTLTGLARGVRALALASDGPGHTVAAAMRAYPQYVGGDGQANTEVMRLLPGTLAKGGAEGVLVAATTAGHAVAVKVIDGNPRATTALALAALAALGVDTAAAAEWARVPVLGGGVTVGEVRVTAALS
ncbi:asparaginase [Streptomyces sp. SID3343]|uniref:asparaginase n=1 Tax=Streptomyces sp. SID3343 TaxID=2690260 RepID=UPI00136B27F5|nr:asparaginase [Streptomyces sp. SID3343]MYW03825.1 asparaginase [Streptomyces sp. SID3343]